MKLFPFSLIRLAGLPFPDANHSLLNAIDEIFQIENKLETQKLQLIAELLNFKNQTPDYSLKNTIKNLIADIRRERTIGKKGKYNLPATILELFDGYESVSEKLQLAKAAFELNYQEAKLSFRQRIQTDLSKESVSESILLSNLSASKQIQKYIRSNEKKFNKKLRQAEVAALKFWSRTTTKTSPFAGLGPLSWVNSITSSNKQVKVNQVLLVYLEEFLMNQDWAREKLRFALNPSLQRKGNSFEYLVNVRNVETIKVIEHQALLELLFEEFSGHQLTFANWGNLLLKYVEVEEKTLLAFLGQLRAEGLLLPVFPSAREEEHWLEKWLTFASVTFPEQVKLIAVLEESIAVEKAQKPKEEQLTQLHQSWKELIGSEFDLVLERILYRDDYWNCEKEVDLNEEIAWIEKITPFLPALNQYAFSKQAAAIELVFADLAVDRISLMDFYLVFHKAKTTNVQSAIDSFMSLEYQLAQRIANLVFPLKKGIINIDEKLLREILKIDEIKESEKWYGALLQKGEGLPFLRNVFPGHGKMMSRFIQDEKITAAIKSINASFVEELVFDHSDNSAFNANLHPKLTAECLATLYPILDQDQKEKLTLSDLEIRKGRAQLELWSISQNKRIRPINYGLEGLNRRSPLYQLIQSFGPKVADFAVIKKGLLCALSEEKEWGNFQPRIQFLNEVVIHRKTWVIKRAAIPAKQKSQTAGSYHIEIVRTFQAMGIPLQGFMKRIKVEGEQSISQIHKPQYFDFGEPIYAQLFHQMVQRTTGPISWEEVYPYPAKKHPFPSHAQEWVIEWIV